MYTKRAGAAEANMSHTCVTSGEMIQPRSAGLEGDKPSGTCSFSVYVSGTR